MRTLIILLLLNYSCYSQLRDSSYIFIRVFKYEKEFEIWVSPSDKVQYTLYKKYSICKLSGILGPKRKEGDLQVPEGFYHINNFNPYSKYKRSMRINYPNKSDSILSPHKKLGGNIYIHGDCLSVGCIAIGNKLIEELFSMCTKTTHKIPVHIFPVRFNDTLSYKVLELKIKTEEMRRFNSNLHYGYDYFEQRKYPPKIIISETGEYIFMDPAQ